MTEQIISADDRARMMVSGLGAYYSQDDYFAQRHSNRKILAVLDHDAESLERRKKRVTTWVLSILAVLIVVTVVDILLAFLVFNLDQPTVASNIAWSCMGSCVSVLTIELLRRLPHTAVLKNGVIHVDSCGE
jgi:hypothetical protein